MQTDLLRLIRTTSDSATLNGRVMETTANSHSPPFLAYSATRWVANQWKFKPSVSGVFTIPISYKQSA